MGAGVYVCGPCATAVVGRARSRPLRATVARRTVVAAGLVVRRLALGGDSLLALSDRASKVSANVRRAAARVRLCGACHHRHGGVAYGLCLAPGCDCLSPDFPTNRSSP